MAKRARMWRRRDGSIEVWVGNERVATHGTWKEATAHVRRLNAGGGVDALHL